MKRHNQPRRRTISARLAGIIGGVLLAAAVVAGGVYFTARAAPPETPTVPISEVLNRAERGEVSRVEVNGSTVTATDASGAQVKSTKEDQHTVTDDLRARGVEVVVTDTSQQAAISPAIAIVPIAAVAALAFIMIRRGGGQSQAFSFGRSNARLFNNQLPAVTFADVAGVDEAKAELSEIVQFLRFPEKFRLLGARSPKGVLLIGPPGTGKTLISRAIAGEATVPFFSISGSEFVEMFVGVGASRVRDLFRQARKQAPCIVFIDEVDAVGRQRGAQAFGNDEREQTLNQLLVEMDGFDSSTGIVVIAATNRPDILDSALTRPGRFDRRVTLDSPDVNGRLAILEVHAKGKPLGPGVELRRIARQTTGFSGADLENLINEAAILSARADKAEIGIAELEEGIMRVLAGPERKSRVISAYERSIIAYHEVGHALVMKAQKHSNPVTKVSVVSRGQALGVTVQSPAEDTYLTSRAQLKTQMASLLGGRMAEDLIFGDITTGARQDIATVTDIARKMVIDLGMSDLGIIATGKKDDQSGAPGVGGELAGKIDGAIKDLLDEAETRARRILAERRETLASIAEHLQSVETIDGDELDELLGPAWTTIDAA